MRRSSEPGPAPADPADLLDSRYREFFTRFNRGHYFEAHEVLESLWLERRGRAEASFYQGLIQIAGAFVHVRKGRPGPAQSLLQLARRRLEPYTPLSHGLALGPVLELIDVWMPELVRRGGTDGAGLPPPQLKAPEAIPPDTRPT